MKVNELQKKNDEELAKALGDLEKARLKTESDAKQAAENKRIEQKLDEKIKGLSNASVFIPEPVQTPVLGKIKATDMTPLEQILNKMVDRTNALEEKNSKAMVRMGYARDLPKFSGKPIEWSKFESSFNRAIEDCGFGYSEMLGKLEKVWWEMP